MNDKIIVPVIGKVYNHTNGSDYRCDGYMDGVSKLVRLSDGWTLKAHNLYQNESGKIYWDFSTESHWEKQSNG